VKRRLLTAAVLASLLLGGGSVASATPTQNIFGATVPPVLHEQDPVPVTVGVVVTAKRAGQVTGLRYYKGPLNTGTHVGALYSRSGRLLARATFTKETASGWQSASFSAPVRVAAGQSVTAAVYMPRGMYTVANPYRWPARSDSLTAVRGVYSYATSLDRPTHVFETSNYFVDMSFKATDASPRPTATTTTTASPRPTAPTSTSTDAPTPWPATSPGASSTATSSAASGWPDASNTGVVGCPPLEKVNNGDEVSLRTNGHVYENKELMNPAVIRVLAHNVTIRCVKMNGTGWFGIDNTDLQDPAPNANDTTIDRVDISCRDSGQRIGILVKSATVTRANVHNCDHFLNAGGDNLVIRDNYCHDLTNLPVVHADCIQTMGGNTNMLIDHNSLWSRDTSDILLGQEFGDARNVVINNNRLMSVGTPPPAYLLYLSGTNTQITNNRFTRRYTYGACTLNTNNPVVWSGNVWDDDGAPLSSCR
jgi:Domain of unknown function (DUF4082)/Right handed beta helix region